MLDEEDISPRKRARLEHPPLDGWSVADLQSYIGELKDEIDRAEAAIGHKQGAKSLADRFFKA